MGGWAGNAHMGGQLRRIIALERIFRGLGYPLARGGQRRGTGFFFKNHAGPVWVPHGWVGGSDVGPPGQGAGLAGLLRGLGGKQNYTRTLTLAAQKQRFLRTPRALREGLGREILRGRGCGACVIFSGGPGAMAKPALDPSNPIVVQLEKGAGLKLLSAETGFSPNFGPWCFLLALAGPGAWKNPPRKTRDEAPRTRPFPAARQKGTGKAFKGPTNGRAF